MEFTDEISKLVQIIFVDLVLAGDNAIVIGLVAAQFNKAFRKKVIFYGVGVAVVLRILFALMTVQLLEIEGLLLVGGALLLWICWKLWKDLRHPHYQEIADKHTEDYENPKNPPLKTAIFHIAMADVSMSLDNVLAVAGIADGHRVILVLGLALSVLLMAVAASIISETLQKNRWIGYMLA
jgi:YjbE family integral membrane protein